MVFPATDYSFTKNWLIKTTCVFWLIAKIISCNVWLSNRLFPLVPPFHFFVAPSFVHMILYVLSILFIGALFFFPHKRNIQVAVVLVELLSCLFDQTRWQPWEYQYIFTILIFLFNKKNRNYIPTVMAFMIVATYFYSGLGKMNAVFIQSIWGKLILIKAFHCGDSIFNNAWILRSGYLLGLIEIGLSIGLLIKQTQKYAALLLIIMHVLILLVFGPIGLNYDAVVWPWNLAMIVYLILLFIIRSQTITVKYVMYQFNVLVVVAFAVLPILNIIDGWDYFLSSSLFSSKTPDMYVCVPNTKDNQSLQKYKETNGNYHACDSNAYLINIRTWSFSELGVPVYPELRVYKSIQEQLIYQYPSLKGRFFINVYKHGRKIRF